MRLDKFYPFRLFSGRQTLSIVEREKIFDNIAKAVAREPQGARQAARSTVFSFGFGRALIAGVCMVLVGVAALVFERRSESEFTARGLNAPSPSGGSAAV